MELINASIQYFPCVESHFSQDFMNRFCESGYNARYHFHFSVGLFVRNELLVDNEPLLALFLKYGITSRDDMSDFVLQLLYLYEKEKRT